LSSVYNSPVEMNDFGQVAFGSFVGGSSFNDFAIFFYDDSVGLVQVARYGDSLLGSTVKSLNLATGASKADTPGGAAGRPFSPLNNRGEIASSFALTDGRAGVAVWTPPPSPELRFTSISVRGTDVYLAWNAPARATSVVQASSSVSGTFMDISGNVSSSGLGQ